MGMRFQCQPNCTICCEVEDGFVYVTESDLARIARYLRMSIRQFVAMYVYRTARIARFRVKGKLRCPFLVSGGCSIHEVKPVQCRLYPFWPEYVDNEREWKKLGQTCPGIGKGELVQISAAKVAAQQMRAEHPTLY
jgi:Fe-S-cluster containining protein